jgi:hypothetical protein
MARPCRIAAATWFRKAAEQGRLAHPVHPTPTFDLDVGLIHSPRAVCRPKMGPYPLLDLGRIALRPTRHGRVIHRDPSIGHMRSTSLKLTGNCRYQRTAQRITSAINWRPLNAFALLAIDQRPPLQRRHYYLAEVRRPNLQQNRGSRQSPPRPKQAFSRAGAEIAERRFLQTSLFGNEVETRNF